MITGLLLWMPLGIVTLVRAARLLSRRTVMVGVGLGIAIHAALSLILFAAATATLRRWAA